MILKFVNNYIERRENILKIYRYPTLLRKQNKNLEPSLIRAVINKYTGKFAMKIMFVIDLCIVHALNVLKLNYLEKKNST